MAQNGSILLVMMQMQKNNNNISSSIKGLICHLEYNRCNRRLYGDDIPKVGMDFICFVAGDAGTSVDVILSALPQKYLREIDGL